MNRFSQVLAHCRCILRKWGTGRPLAFHLAGIRRALSVTANL